MGGGAHELRMGPGNAMRVISLDGGNEQHLPLFQLR